MFLHTVQRFAAPPEAIFDFFSDARNLEEITPPWLNFRILTEGEIEMREGTLIDYALKVNLVPIRWRSEISAWEPGRRFVDRQVRGPYRRWVHEHRFVEREGAIEVHDLVDYAVPGPSWVERWFVRPQLRSIFRHRQEAMADRFLQQGVARVEFREATSLGAGDVSCQTCAALSHPRSTATR